VGEAVPDVRHREKICHPTPVVEHKQVTELDLGAKIAKPPSRFDRVSKNTTLP
jgi:hypothetical protein